MWHVPLITHVVVVEQCITTMYNAAKRFCELIFPDTWEAFSVLFGIGQAKHNNTSHLLTHAWTVPVQQQYWRCCVAVYCAVLALKWLCSRISEDWEAERWCMRGWRGGWGEEIGFDLHQMWTTNTVTQLADWTEGGKDYSATVHL